MIKFATITIDFRKKNFNSIIYFDEHDDMKKFIETEIDSMIQSISKLTYIPKYFIKKCVYNRPYSIGVDICKIQYSENYDDTSCQQKFERFKSDGFCNNDHLSSFILDKYYNKAPHVRLLCFGNLDRFTAIRRHLSDYEDNFVRYNVGDVVKIQGFDDLFIITYKYDNVNSYDFCDTYDVFCIKNNKIHFIEDDGIHREDIIELICNDNKLAVQTIINNKYFYNIDYVNKICDILINS